MLLSVNISFWANFPKSPFAKAVSNVAILLDRIKDCFLSPFAALGETKTSVDSCQSIRDVTKQTVRSRLVATSTKAGLSFVPLRSENGKVIRTIPPYPLKTSFRSDSE